MLHHCEVGGDRGEKARENGWDRKMNIWVKFEKINGGGNKESMQMEGNKKCIGGFVRRQRGKERENKEWGG